MDLKEFLKLNDGKWFSLRTIYYLSQSQTENSKAEISLENVSQENPDVIQLCQKYKINPGLSIGGIKTSWDNSVDWGKTKQTGNAIFVLIPNSDVPLEGKLLRKIGGVDQSSLMGSYSLGKDDALTLSLEVENNYSWNERIFFASDNLRVRTTFFQKADGFTMTSFYSEIRKVPLSKE